MDGGTITAVTDAAQAIGVVGVALLITLIILFAGTVFLVAPAMRSNTATNRLLLTNLSSLDTERKMLQAQVNDLNTTVGQLKEDRERQDDRLKEQAEQVANLQESQRVQKAAFDRDLTTANDRVAELEAALNNEQAARVAQERKQQQAIDDLIRENKALKEDNQKLTQRIDEIDTERKALKRDNEAKDRTIQRLQNELTEVKERVRQLERKPDTGPLNEPEGKPDDRP